MAVDAFVNPPGEEIATVLLSNSLEDASRRRSMLDLRARQRSDVLDRRRAALGELEAAEQSAQQTKNAADSTQQQQQAAVDQLTAAQQQQQSFADALERRLDNSLSEADGLDGLDSSMAGQLVAQAGSLSAAAAAAGITPLGGPSYGSISSTPTVQIVNVGGFNVNVAIAPQLTALLAAFSTTGHKLGGGAYRSPQQQIALRISHCGSDPYSIYQKPSSQCSPPTAPPGRSMHEVGLAIDFQCDGSAHLEPLELLLHVVGGQRSQVRTAEPAVGAVALEHQRQLVLNGRGLLRSGSVAALPASLRNLGSGSQRPRPPPFRLGRCAPCFTAEPRLRFSTAEASSFRLGRCAPCFTAEPRLRFSTALALAEQAEEPQDLEVEPDERDRDAEGAVPLHVLRGQRW